MKSIINLLLFLNFSCLTMAQSVFQSTFEGLGAERGYSVEVCDDGYLLVGSSNTSGAGQNDVLVIKTDRDGLPVWKKTYGGFNDDSGRRVKRIHDNHFIIAGTTNSFTSDSMNFYVLKIDSMGGLLWSRIFGGPGQDSAINFVETYDHGLLIVGTTNSIGAGMRDVYLLKLDSAGNYLWSKAIGNTGSEVATSLIEMADHGFLITGYTNGFGFSGNTAFLLRVNEIGDVQWVKTIDPGTAWNSPRDVRANDIIKGYLNDYLVVGQECCGPVNDGRHFVLDIDSMANFNWMKDYQLNSGRGSAQSIVKSDDGNFITGGQYSSGAACALKIDVLGNNLWTWYYDAGQSYEIKTTADGQFVLAGYTPWVGDNVAYLIKPDGDGSLNCSSNLPFTGMIFSVNPTISSQTFSSTTTNFGLWDSCQVSNSFINDSSLCLYTHVDDIRPGDLDIKIYPNPTDEYFTISVYPFTGSFTLEILDALGRRVYIQKQIQATAIIEVGNLDPGLYYIKMRDERRIRMKQLVIK